MIKKLIFLILIMCGIYIVPMSINAAETDLFTGTWLTVDDDTKQPTSYVKISVINNRLDATVVKLLENPDAVCSQCTDYRKNQPITGMKIISGLIRKSQNEWGDGEILDPDNGKTYRVSLRLDNGKLVVRGYIGISIFGREQVWTRLSKD